MNDHMLCFLDEHTKVDDNKLYLDNVLKVFFPKNLLVFSGKDRKLTWSLRGKGTERISLGMDDGIRTKLPGVDEYGKNGRRVKFEIVGDDNHGFSELYFYCPTMYYNYTY